MCNNFVFNLFHLFQETNKSISDSNPSVPPHVSTTGCNQSEKMPFLDDESSSATKMQCGNYSKPIKTSITDNEKLSPTPEKRMTASMLQGKFDRNI